MTEADILAATYTDTVTVYMPFKVSSSNGETVFKKGKDGLKVHDNVPCALSSHSGGQVNRTESAASAPVEYSLFVRPEVEIAPDDFLEVTRLGKTEYYIAGVAERHISHNNIPLKNAKEFV